MAGGPRMVRCFICLAVVCALVPAALPDATVSPPAPAASPAPPAEPRAGAGTGADDVDAAAEEPPEGYYAFVESPNATPPRVRPPPYRQVASECAEAGEGKPHVTAHNLCGDLNRGVIPRNPMGQSPNGEPYPFELIRNQTLRFLSRTLPVLRADDTLPRVAHIAHPAPTASRSPSQHLYDDGVEERSKRSLEAGSDAVPSRELRMEHRGSGGDADTPRESRKFCDGGGVFCMLYRAINGDSPAGGVERREDPGLGPAAAPAPHPSHAAHPRYEGPPTPCPARVEYATPVFARNYQGVWRYVVQIPYEGYFTQTVEVTRCMQSRCHYLEGGCLSSPRWVSLLVAELHYPQEYQQQQFIQKRGGPAGAYSAGEGVGAGGSGGTSAGAGTTDRPPHCDGHDELGCYQVRLYYDWFLVPGSCKCWRPDYFARYVRRRHSNEL